MAEKKKRKEESERVNLLSEEALLPKWVQNEMERELAKPAIMYDMEQHQKLSVNDKPATAVLHTTSNTSGNLVWNSSTTQNSQYFNQYKANNQPATFLGEPIPPSWRWDHTRRAFEHRSGIFISEAEMYERGRFPTEGEVHKMERRRRRDRAGRRRAGVTTRGKLTLEITEDTDMLRDLMEELADLADEDGIVTLTIQGYGIDVRILGSEFKEDTRERTAE